MAFALPRETWWTAHALARWREHHPGAHGAQMLTALAEGAEESADLVTALLGRAQSAARDTKYVRAADGRGIFVLVQLGVAWQIRTYVRLGERQRAIAAGETSTGTAAHAVHRREALRLLATDVSAKAREGRQPSMPRLVELAEGVLWLIAEGVAK